jgi:lysozyme
MEFYEIIDKLYDKPSPMYTGSKYTKRFVKGTGLENHPLWVAHYNDKIKEPKVYPNVWSSWDIWQNSSTGRVPGISGDCDINICKSGLSRFII